MEEKGTEKKSNKFTRTLVILLIVFIAVLVLLSSRPCQRFTLTGESVILVVLLVILALSEVFDRFQLGNLLTLEQEKKAKEERLREVSAENQQLRAQLTTIVSSSVANHNTAIFGMPSKEQLLSLIGTEPAEPDEVDEKERTELASNAPAPETPEPATAPASEARSRGPSEAMLRHRLLPRIEALCLDRYSEMLQVSKYSIARATKFSDAFVNIDPIMEQNIIFDGYYRSPLGEQFIEVSTSFRMMSMDMLPHGVLFRRRQPRVIRQHAFQRLPGVHPAAHHAAQQLQRQGHSPSPPNSSCATSASSSPMRSPSVGSAALHAPPVSE